MEGLFLYIFLFGVLAVFFLKWASLPRIIGLIGERRVNGLLSKSLTDARYTIHRDVTLNTGRGTTQIDHMVVSPYGIFVIETKNMSGWISGSESNAEWVQSFRRKKIQFDNPLRQNLAHIKALQGLLGLQASQFHSIVVFTGDTKFKTQMPSNVMRAGGLLPHIQIRTKQLIDHGEVQKLVSVIESARLTPGAESNAAHIKSLQVKHGRIL